MSDRHAVAESTAATLAGTQPESSAKATPESAPTRRHVLDCVRERENAVFGDVRSPVDRAIEDNADRSLQQRSPGWTSRSW